MSRSQFTESGKEKIILEAALMCAQDPLKVSDLRKLFIEPVSDQHIIGFLDALRADWLGRGVELVEVAGGWRFQSVPAVQVFLDRLNPEKPPKYSRAVLETLAVIAYRQPVTRGDIEEIRGVAVNTQAIRQLEERGWIEIIGQRNAPGYPSLYATTQTFLNNFGLQTLNALPTLPESTAETA